MRVLLLNPRYFESHYRYKVNKLFPPLGLTYLASSLIAEGHEVSILDMEAIKMEWIDLAPFLIEKSPDVIGIHGTTPIAKYIKLCAEIAKVSVKNVTVVVGGAHATLLPEEMLANIPQIDYILRGEADKTICELLRIIENDDNRANLNNITGICYKKNNKSGFQISNQIAVMDNLNELPLPAYDLLQMEAYYECGTKERASTIISSRGCPFNCAFCSVPALYGRKFRSRTAENIMMEIRLLVSKYRIQHIVFYDASFLIDQERVKQLCDKLINESLGITWRCRCRADSIRKDMIEHMKNAGCTEISIGVESGSQRILDLMNKKINLGLIEKTFQIIREAGIWTSAYFILGWPTETTQEIYQTIEFAKLLDPDWALFSIATPLPKTQLSKTLKIQDLTSDWSKYKFTANSPVVEYPELSKEDLSKLFTYAYQSFYLRKSWLSDRLAKAPREKIQGIVDSFFFYLENTLSFNDEDQLR